jgi:hypothetical protein
MTRAVASRIVRPSLLLRAPGILDGGEASAVDTDAPFALAASTWTDPAGDDRGIPRRGDDEGCAFPFASTLLWGWLVTPFSAPLRACAPDWLGDAEEARLRPRRTCGMGSFIDLSILERFDQLWHYGENVADNSEIGDVEDGGVRILVDCHDCLSGLHSSAMLYRPGDA